MMIRFGHPSRRIQRNIVTLACVLTHLIVWSASRNLPALCCKFPPMLDWPPTLPGRPRSWLVHITFFFEAKAAPVTSWHYQVWQQPTNMNILKSHDPWRSRQHWHDQDDIPLLADLYTTRKHCPPPPPQDEPARLPPGLQSPHWASSSAIQILEDDFWMTILVQQERVQQQTVVLFNVLVPRVSEGRC